MMSVCAFIDGTPGTSSSTAAVIAMPSVPLPAHIAPSPAIDEARKATIAMRTKAFVSRATSAMRTPCAMVLAAKIGATEIQSVPSRRPKAAQAIPAAAAIASRW